MNNPRIVGHIVAVQGFRVRVELLPETKSSVRATLDGLQVAIAINAYLSFSIGAGQVVIGVITDLESRESFDPAAGEELTLELLKPRRVASVQLLGAILNESGRRAFDPGITVLPTLDTPAEIGSPEVLRAVFETPPIRNRPENYLGEDFDFNLTIGKPTGQPTSEVRASYNDLFSRPLAIVGNTGSGKSFTVSSLVQKAMSALSGALEEPHVFVLDINGEYSKAFPSPTDIERKPDHIYLNGEEFGVPIWFLNAEEVCAWLSASEQTQEPVLKDWWALAKAGNQAGIAGGGKLQYALSTIDQLLLDLPGLKRKAAGSYCDGIRGLLDGSGVNVSAFTQLFQGHKGVDKFNTEIVANQAEILEAAQSLGGEVRAKIAASAEIAEQGVRTADSPLYISRKALTDPAMINRTVSKEDAFRVEAHLTTLKLRLKTRLDDRRWRAFLNYDADPTRVSELSEWFGRLGIGATGRPKVSILDLSMLSNEILPFACAVVGRILLEARECLPAADRYKHPWVLILEEAHNYARPARADEDRGHKLARLSYERIAKEGRKFGLSLVIASQRPSEISPTIISQCANFVCHRLQNPDDIDHFRRIIPMQARRLLDQVTILAAGEAIVFGSAFHVPTRVQFDRPAPGPYSQTAAPYHEWRTEKKPFPLEDVIRAWGVGVAGDKAIDPPVVASEETAADFDDSIPF